MTSHSTLSATRALRAHYPRLTILVLAFTARLILTGCAAAPAVLESTPLPAVVVTSDEARAERDSFLPSEDELHEGSSDALTAQQWEAAEKSPDFIPGC